MTALAEDMNRVGGKRSAHKPRAYVLVDVAKGHSEAVTSVLRGKPGVVMADVLETQPNVIMVVEAEERQALAKLTIQALSSVEMLTEGVHLMPAEDYGEPMACKGQQ